MNEDHLAKVNWNSKSKEKIQLSKWREQACFWRQNSNDHRKWREQACFSMFSRWRQISNSNRMRNICRNGARSEADLAQCGALALPPPFLCLWLLVQIFFFNAPYSKSHVVDRWNAVFSCKNRSVVVLIVVIAIVFVVDLVYSLFWYITGSLTWRRWTIAHNFLRHRRRVHELSLRRRSWWIALSCQGWTLWRYSQEMEEP